MPSRSALMAAVSRAAHLEVDRPPYLFEDTLALRLLGSLADEPLAYQRQSGDHPALAGTRLVTTARARYAEDRLAQAVDRGIGQYVILGAGLDTFAWRSPLAGRVRAFEVDEPGTSAWKRELLEKAGLATGPNVALVPADLRAADLLDRLAAAGFDASRPAFLSWLGVSMYLSPEAIGLTLRETKRMARGSEVVFDHVLPPAERDEAGAQYAAFAESVGAANGEPWITALSRRDARVLVEGAGLEVVAQPSLRDWVDPALWNREDAIAPSALWAMVRAERGDR